MHIEGWHLWAGGTGAFGIVIGSLRWLFSQFNGKMDRSTGQILFDKIEGNTKDIAALRENTAITRTKVESMEGGVKRIEDKIGRALNGR